MHIGIIGGTGFENLQWLVGKKTKIHKTKVGFPSSPLLTGVIHGHEVTVISRHGKDHQYTPTHVPYAANILALKSQGCTHVLATTACGSLRRSMKPGDIVFVDQMIDMTKHRDDTLFHNRPTHTAMAEPFDARLRTILVRAARLSGMRFHSSGTMITIEGPRFSTRAESRMFRLLGADVINMTTATEAILAREAGLSYQAIAMVTDYDSWDKRILPVTEEIVFDRMKKSALAIQELLHLAISHI